MKASASNLEITYEPETDMAYIYLSGIGKEEALETYSCEDLPELVNADINLDFDKNGRLRGVELSNASQVLPPEVLKGLRK